jgi:hypothetical protein
MSLNGVAIETKKKIAGHEKNRGSGCDSAYPKHSTIFLVKRRRQNEAEVEKAAILTNSQPFVLLRP